MLIHRHCWLQACFLNKLPKVIYHCHFLTKDQCWRTGNSIFLSNRCLCTRSSNSLIIFTFSTKKRSFLFAIYITTCSIMRHVLRKIESRLTILKSRLTGQICSVKIRFLQNVPFPIKRVPIKWVLLYVYIYIYIYCFYQS